MEGIRSDEVGENWGTQIGSTGGVLLIRQGPPGEGRIIETAGFSAREIDLRERQLGLELEMEVGCL